MIKKIIPIGLSSLVLIALSGCELTDEEKEKLNDAQVDLEQLADQIIITYPANNATILEGITTVRADIPAAAQAKEVTLYVDGIEVAKDTDGAPWEIQWPAYYWADGHEHTLLLKTITEGGNEVRNNQQFQVKVDVTANKLLSFEQGIDGTELKNVDSLAVQFAAFPGSSKYELKYANQSDESVIETNELQANLTELQVGEYTVSYRAIMDYSSLTSMTGPWSDAINFTVQPPDLPVIEEAEVTSDSGNYNLLLSWENLGENNTYQVHLESVEDPTNVTIYHDIQANELSISNVQSGKYQWRLTRTNSLGHNSLQSDANLINVGVFTKYLGGSRSDYSKQIIPSQDGGYIILGWTKSYEISDSVDSQGDDWIIKLSSQGDIEWQYISNASGRNRFEDITELENGSIVLVGQDWSTSQAVALKLDKDGVVEWEITYRPENVSERYDFLEVVEIQGKLYVVSAEWGQGSCDSCIRRSNYYLHSLSLTDGTVSEQFIIPSIDGVVIDSVNEFAKTSSDSLLIAGSALPVSDIDKYHVESGAYMQILSPELLQLVTWDSFDEYAQGNVSDAVELSNGKYAIVGQVVFSAEPHITIVNSDGTEHKNWSGDYEKDYYSGASVFAGDNGEVYALFEDLDSDHLKIMAFEENLSLEFEEYLLGFNQYVHPSGVIKNSDGTFTLLLREAQDGSDNYDIVITKVKLD
ncbi:Ig-like domain-containing protein [Catenovulum sp. SX2]|uniref:Ig-like domain-containing protein n=1 Tax=Catenovulum sp. SX2 TaxID=3398614 RepID=UPI003F84C590